MDYIDLLLIVGAVLLMATCYFGVVALWKWNEKRELARAERHAEITSLIDSAINEWRE